MNCIQYSHCMLNVPPKNEISWKSESKIEFWYWNRVKMFDVILHCRCCSLSLNIFDSIQNISRLAMKRPIILSSFIQYYSLFSFPFFVGLFIVENRTISKCFKLCKCAFYIYSIWFLYCWITIMWKFPTACKQKKILINDMHNNQKCSKPIIFFFNFFRWHILPLNLSITNVTNVNCIQDLMQK